MLEVEKLVLCGSNDLEAGRSLPVSSAFEALRLSSWGVFPISPEAPNVARVLARLRGAHAEFVTLEFEIESTAGQPQFAGGA